MITRTIRITDYKHDWNEVTVDMDGVLDIYLMILSGDEVLRIHRSNGQEEIIDSYEYDRIESIYQGGYYIYDATNPDDIYDITDQPEWLNRRYAESYLSTLCEKRKESNDES